MWAYLSYGTVLGLSAGFSPGPLLTLVISQTLQHGTREGVRVAAVPLLTDLPIIFLVLFAFSSLSDPEFVLGAVSVFGGLFVLTLGLKSLRQGPVKLELNQSEPRSYLKGVLVNVLSPHPYLFWVTVGAPTMLKANQHGAIWAVGFVCCFYVCIVSAKVAVALLVGRSRQFLSAGPYLWVMRLLGLLLVGFAMLLFYDGAILLGFFKS